MKQEFNLFHQLNLKCQLANDQLINLKIDVQID